MVVKRRELLIALGGALVALPLAASAQQPAGMRRIGVLMNATPDDLPSQASAAVFVQELHRLGWTDRRNVQIEFRWAGSDASRVRRYAAELVARAPAVILAIGGFGVGPLQQETRTIPIVFVSVADPV